MNPITAWLEWLRSIFRPPPPPAVSPGEMVFEWFTAAKPETASIGRAPIDGSTPPVRLTPAGKHRDWGPIPSPDGKTILFKRSPIGHLGSLADDVWLMDPDGRHPRRIISLTDGQADHGFTHAGHHEWSLDGQSLWFAADGPATRSFAIYRMRLGDGHLEQVTSGDTLDADPSVCPDGRILFCRRPGISSTVQEIWIMNPDGTGQTQLTRDEVGLAEWDVFAHPAGDRCVFLRQSDAFGLAWWDNWVMSLDGTGRRIVAHGRSSQTSYGVARWASNDLDETRVLSSRIGRRGMELISYDVDSPGVKRVILPATRTDRFRDPIPL